MQQQQTPPQSPVDAFDHIRVRSAQSFGLMNAEGAFSRMVEVLIAFAVAAMHERDLVQSGAMQVQHTVEATASVVANMIGDLVENYFAPEHRADATDFIIQQIALALVQRNPKSKIIRVPTGIQCHA